MFKRIYKKNCATDEDACKSFFVRSLIFYTRLVQKGDDFILVFILRTNYMPKKL
jgi:hypothetical protein